MTDSGLSSQYVFVYRNLYPYELYITGGDYQGVVEKIKSGMPIGERVKKKKKKQIDKENNDTVVQENDLDFALGKNEKFIVIYTWKF